MMVTAERKEKIEEDRTWHEEWEQTGPGHRLVVGQLASGENLAESSSFSFHSIGRTASWP